MTTSTRIEHTDHLTEGERADVIAFAGNGSRFASLDGAQAALYSAFPGWNVYRGGHHVALVHRSGNARVMIVEETQQPAEPARNGRVDVRNPLLGMPAAAKIAALPPEARAALRDLLREISADARARADKSWRTHKAPMACYWKAVAVYAGHASRIAR